MKTDEIIKTYRFKSTDLTPETVIAMTVVDVASDICDDAYAYFPDLDSYGLIVYSLKNDDSWRLRHSYFHLEPLAANMKVGGVKFQWYDGIFSGALTDINSDGFRDFIFHSMAGFNLYNVSTRILRDKDLAARSFHDEDFKVSEVTFCFLFILDSQS